MKKRYRTFLSSLLSLLGFAACSPEPGPDMYGPVPVMYGPAPAEYIGASQVESPQTDTPQAEIPLEEED